MEAKGHQSLGFPGLEKTARAGKVPYTKDDSN